MIYILKKHGWHADFSFSDKSCPYSVNIHTHGLGFEYNHLDLQICFPMSRELSFAIFCGIVDCIKNGKKITAGILYSNIIMDYDVEFAEAKESGRVVLRVIFPDKYGNLRGEYSNQWKGCRIYPTSN